MSIWKRIGKETEKYLTQHRSIYQFECNNSCEIRIVEETDAFLENGSMLATIFIPDQTHSKGKQTANFFHSNNNELISLVESYDHELIDNFDNSKSQSIVMEQINFHPEKVEKQQSRSKFRRFSFSNQTMIISLEQKINQIVSQFQKRIQKMKVQHKLFSVKIMDELTTTKEHWKNILLNCDLFLSKEKEKYQRTIHQANQRIVQVEELAKEKLRLLKIIETLQKENESLSNEISLLHRYSQNQFKKQQRINEMKLENERLSEKVFNLEQQVVGYDLEVENRIKQIIDFDIKMNNNCKMEKQCTTCLKRKQQKDECQLIEMQIGKKMKSLEKRQRLISTDQKIIEEQMEYIENEGYRLHEQNQKLNQKYQQLSEKQQELEHLSSKLRQKMNQNSSERAHSRENSFQNERYNNNCSSPISEHQLKGNLRSKFSHLNSDRNMRRFFETPGQDESRSSKYFERNHQKNLDQLFSTSHLKKPQLNRDNSIKRTIFKDRNQRKYNKFIKDLPSSNQSFEHPNLITPKMNSNITQYLQYNKAAEYFRNDMKTVKVNSIDDKLNHLKNDIQKQLRRYH